MNAKAALYSCLLVAALIITTGCSRKKSFIYIPLVVDNPTYALVQTPSGLQSGNVSITYTLTDLDANPSDVMVQYSVDGGANWNSATRGEGGEGTVDLTTSKGGTDHTFIWNSLTDRVALGMQEDDVRIKVTPFTRTQGFAGTSNDFSVNNVQPPGNRPPMAGVTTPAGIQSGNVSIIYKLYDDDNDNCSILVEYTLNTSGNWQPATEGAGSEGISDLTSSSAGIVHTFVWDSLFDGVAASSLENSVRIRITPSDTAPGEPGFTNLFTVDNRPPETPANPSPYDGEINVALDAILGWDNSARADGYYVFFGNSSDPPYVSTVSDSSYAPGALDYLTSYYWKVIAYNTGGNSSEASGSFGTKALFTITATAGANGTINPSGSVPVLQGDNQSFTITPDTDYHVKDVLVGGVSVGAITDYEFVNVSADDTISATFSCSSWTDVSPGGTEGTDFPTARYLHAMAYDFARDVVVLFGGDDTAPGYCSDTWEWNGTVWTDVSPGGTEGSDFPTARWRHAQAYDSARGVVVLFGGWDAGGRCGDTWEWNGTAWTDVSPGGTEGTDFPTARYLHAMAYDSARGVVVLFGGTDGGFPYFSDTWEWNGTSWTNVSPGGTEGVDFPNARYIHAMAYDSARGVVVLFGGYDGSYFSDTWEWNGTAWSDVSPGGTEGADFPNARDSHAMAYDSARGAVVLFGGYDGSLFSDTWEWNGTVWTDVSPGGTEGTDFPTARGVHALAYDSARGAVMLFGGNDGGYFSDTWEYRGGPITPPGEVVLTSPADASSNLSLTTRLSWQHAQNACSYDVYLDENNPPTTCVLANQSHSFYTPAALNSVTTYYWKVVAWNPAGSNSSNVWSFTTAPPWQNVSPGGTEGVDFPTARVRHAVAYDSARGVVVLFGGYDGGERSDTWEWNGTVWTDVSPGGTEGTDFPTARSEHTLAYDSARGVVVLFGGWDGGLCSNTWEWNGTVWTNVSPGGTEGTDFPTKRDGHAMAYDSARGVVVLFGGFDGGERSDTWEWNGTVWTDVSPGGTEGTDFPVARRSHAMAYDSARGVVVLFGGEDPALCNDTWEWNGTVWTDVSSGGTEGVDFPTARDAHALAYDSARGAVVLFGGWDGGFCSDTWEWNGTGWTDVSPGGTEGTDFPTARGEHTLAYDSARGVVVLFGGFDGGERSDTWEYKK